MIKISKQNNSLIVEGIDNVFYPNNGDNSYPLNSLIVVTDNSDMATFRSVATNDVLFSGLIKDITINGEVVTKDNIIQKFDAVSNSSTGGGGGGGTVDAYTKSEADAKFASKDELTNVQTVANDADTKVDALTPRVEGVETSVDGKQDLLVSGTNIKTINNQSILGEGNIEISDYYTKTEADEIFATTTQVNHQAADISALQTDMRGKQATLVSGENIKTINSESILGTGDIQINGVSEEQAQEIAKIPTLETELAQKANVSDVPTVQTGYQGTNKKYIYSEGNIDDNNKTVVSNIVNVNDNPDTVKLGIYEWGGSMGKVIKLPSATTTVAGVMTAADKTKLDSIPENIPTQTEVDNIAANVSTLQTDMLTKQPTLVSGTNIKTINNQSILGEGNLEITGGDVDLTNYYTKTEADGKFATKDELTAVETVANNADAKADAATSRIESVETTMGNKQDTLVSGTNIKTVNSQSILGEGNIEVSGGIKIYEASEIPKKLNDALYQVVYEAYYTVDKNAYIDKSTDIEEFLNYLKTGDYLQVTEEVLIQYYGIISGLYKFAIKTGKEKIDIQQYGKLITVQILSNMFFITNNASGPVLQKNDLKTINGEKIVGSGNIEVSGVSEEQAQEIAKIPTLETNMMGKQDTLVSGTNIKTINGNSILGEGNLVIEGGGVDLSNYYTKTETDTKLDTKQNTLVSGTNIKTVNSQSILGEGNIEVTIPDATTATSGAMSAADKTKLDSMSNEWTGTQSEYDALTTKEDNIIYYVTE